MIIVAQTTNANDRLFPILQPPPSLSTPSEYFPPSTTTEQSMCILPPSTRQNSWLREQLESIEMSEAQIRQIESVLFEHEGFSSEASFAQFPPENFTLQYLRSLGLTAMGTAHALVNLQKGLNEKYRLMQVPLYGILDPLHNAVSTIPAATDVQCISVDAREISWIEYRMREACMAVQHIGICEDLLLREGIHTEDAFACLQPDLVTIPYFQSIGIKALGTAHSLVILHRRMHARLETHINNTGVHPQLPALEMSIFSWQARGFALIIACLCCMFVYLSGLL